MSKEKFNWSLSLSCRRSILGPRTSLSSKDETPSTEKKNMKSEFQEMLEERLYELLEESKTQPKKTFEGEQIETSGTKGRRFGSLGVLNLENLHRPHPRLGLKLYLKNSGQAKTGEGNSLNDRQDSSTYYKQDTHLKQDNATHAREQALTRRQRQAIARLFTLIGREIPSIKTPKDFMRVYRILLKKWHPDLNSSHKAVDPKLSTERLMLLKEIKEDFFRPCDNGSASG